MRDKKRGEEREEEGKKRGRRKEKEKEEKGGGKEEEEGEKKVEERAGHLQVHACLRLGRETRTRVRLRASEICALSR
ncbi:unnamed protein product [Victoria cruziana]